MRATNIEGALARIQRSARRAVLQWVRRLPFEQLVLLMEVAKPGGLGMRGDVAGAARSSRGVIRQLERRLTPEEAEMVRQRLGNLRPGMPGYKQARDRVCRQMRATPRQVAMCVANAKRRGSAMRPGKKARSRPADAAEKRR